MGNMTISDEDVMALMNLLVNFIPDITFEQAKSILYRSAFMDVLTQEDTSVKTR